jgi:TonB family protein
MKLNQMLIAASLLFSSSLALASSGPYQVEVIGLQGLAINSGTTVWQPLPLYPRMALRHNMTGKVLVEYSVNEQGKAENIVILQSSGKGFFDRTTVRALENASFGIAYEEGQAVPVHGVKKRFVYAIERNGAGKQAGLQASVQ